MNFLIGILLAVATASPAPQITGTVVDDNGKPVSGVSVSVEPVMGGPVVVQVASQKDGSFSVSGIPSGSYGVVAKTSSACAISRAIGISDGYTSVVHLRLVKGFCQAPAISL